MNLFHKRPLSLILCVMLGGFAIFTLCGLFLKIAVAVIALGALIVSFIIKRFEKSKIVFIRVLSISLIACISLSYLYFGWFFLDSRYAEEVQITAEVTDKNFESFNKIADVKTKTINGKRVSGRKLRVYFEDEDLYDLCVGDTISFSATLTSFESYDSSFDAEAYYASKGYSALAADGHTVSVVEGGTPSLSYRLSSYRKSLTEKIISYTDKNSGGLLAALLFGDRSSLSPMLSLDFSRIGITHVLALSGMHLVILGFALEKLLSLFKLNKKWQKAGSAIFALLYMAFTGFPVSVVRAGVMTIIASLLFLLSSERDSVTNLFISVTIICLVQPYSVFDMSLWLSAIATLGVILASELKAREEAESGKKKNRFISYVKSSLLISTFAISATFMITVSAFKEISIMLLALILLLIVLFMHQRLILFMLHMSMKHIG